MQNFLNTIWMGDLEPSMDESFIKRAFEAMGESIVSVKVIRNKITQQPLGYCFVEFPDAHAAKDAMLKLNGKMIPGTTPTKRFKLNQASYGKDGAISANDYSVFVGELSEEVDDHALYKIFRRYPSCKFAKVLMDGGRSRGYGFVRFGDESDQKKCLTEMQNYQGLGNKLLKVSLATPKRADEMELEMNSAESGESDPFYAAVAAAVSGNSQKQAEYYQMYQSYYQHFFQFGGVVPNYPQPPAPLPEHVSTNQVAAGDLKNPEANRTTCAQLGNDHSDHLVDPNSFQVSNEDLLARDYFVEMENSRWDCCDANSEITGLECV